MTPNFKDKDWHYRALVFYYRHKGGSCYYYACMFAGLVREVGYKDAETLSTNNDMGIDDEFYTENLDGEMERLKDARADESYTDTPEYDDLTFFLKVCREVGFDSLVVISLVHGGFHDWEGISADTRAACRDRVVDICEKAGVEYLNLGDKDYDKYFVHDIVYYGGPGWVTLEEALYEFANEE